MTLSEIKNAAVACFENSEYKSSGEWSLRGLKIDPKNSSLQVILIKSLLAESRFVEATKAVKILVSISPENIDNVFQMMREFSLAEKKHNLAACLSGFCSGEGLASRQIYAFIESELMSAADFRMTLLADCLCESFPNDPTCLNMAGSFFYSKRLFYKAQKVYEALLLIDGRSDEWIYAYATCLLQLQRPAEALVLFNELLQRGNSRSEVLANRGIAYMDLGRMDLAEADFNKVISIHPDLASCHLNRSLVWLTQGRYAEGFAEYEWGWIAGNRGARKFPNIALWLGETDLSGKNLLISCEQGLGDIFQCFRFIKQLVNGGALVTFEARKNVYALLKEGQSSFSIVPEPADTSVGFDLHCPLMSLPYALKSFDPNCWWAGSYIFPASDRVVSTRRLLNRRYVNIGVCSQGSVGTLVDVGRSFPERFFERLVSLGQIRLYNLRKDDKEISQCDGRGEGLIIPFPTAFDRDDGFVDTAALIKNLDLVITTDTSIAHLAGAIGKPVWVLLKKVPDWRWGLVGSRSPWYPSARLYRQQESGDWSSALRQIELDLASEVEEILAGRQID